MIHLRDATMLALTKLRTRKIRLTVTIVISGLLFSGLAAASFVARGVMDSVGSFGKEGLGDRYIVQAYPQADYYYHSNPELMDRAAAIHKDTVARKKAEAKRLGLTYSAEAETSPIQEFDTPDGKQKYLNSEHPAAKQAIQEYQATHPAPNREVFEQTAKKYNAINVFESKMMPYGQSGGQLQVLKDGKESFESSGPGKSSGPSNGTDSFITSWSAMSSDLLEPFILPQQNLQPGTDGSVPIIVPRSAAEQLLGLKELPSSATASERLDRTKQIREKAPDIRFSVCYRNTASSNLVQQAISTQQEIDKNKGKKDYQKPDLIYGLPTEPCGSVGVTRDVRTKEEKTLAAKQQQFDELFGAEPATQSTMTFRVVGIVPDMNYGGAAFSVGEIIRSLLTSSLGPGWFTPMEQMDASPLMQTLFNRNEVYSTSNFYAEFATSGDAKHFIDKENCAPDYSNMKPGVDSDVLKPCREKGQNFSVNPYGSNSLALEGAKKTFGKVFWYAALVVSVIAGIIMMGTVGRMIADSRRETAVFRAIGAKKLDIAQIYVIYVICLSLLVSLFALLAGLILSLVAHDRWSADATIHAITAYNSQDLDKTFSLYAFYLPDVLLLVGLALAAGLLSAVFPLFRNLRRNPIRDMRDDT